MGPRRLIFSIISISFTMMSANNVFSESLEAAQREKCIVAWQKQTSSTDIATDALRHGINACLITKNSAFSSGSIC